LTRAAVFDFAERGGLWVSWSRAEIFHANGVMTKA